MQRRTFLALTTSAIQALMAGVVGLPVIRFILAPLRHSSRELPFLRVAPLSTLSRDKPTRVTVSSDRWDMFTHYASGPIGSVWLIRDAHAADTPVVRCLGTICPHLGCGIQLASDGKSFNCPCHQSLFGSQGQRLNNVSPRDMDELPCRLSEPDEDGHRWVEVKYERFQTGIADKRPVT